MAVRTRNIYKPRSEKPYNLSRSKLDLFLECKKCFYIDRRLGVGRPPGFPFNINSAVDTLLKKEFDVYRSLQKPHPLMKKYGIQAVPFQHSDLDVWRENFKGIRFLHKDTNLTITGAIDDLWVNEEGELIVVDYKATSKIDEIVSLEENWHRGYKRQLEIYQWLLRKNGFTVSNKAYWVYANGDTSQDSFDAKMIFRMSVIEYNGNSDWVEKTVVNAKSTLDQDTCPEASENCDYCSYVEHTSAVLSSNLFLLAQNKGE
jgi:hypothetical protein